MITWELGQMYRDGDVIFHEGEKGSVMYVIQFGKVAIKRQVSSEEVTLATLGMGEIFGEMALIDKKPRSATAIAQGDARVLSIDKKKFFASVSRDPTVAFNMLKSLSQRIRRLDGQVTELKNKAR